MIYQVIVSPTAEEGILALKKNEPSAYKKNRKPNKPPAP